VMALCPGVTDTNFFAASQMGRPPLRTIETAEDVVETALRGLRHRKASVISGWANWLQVEAERFVPRSVVTKIAGKAIRSQLEE